MEDRQLYAQILGIQKPWEVTSVELKRAEGEVRVMVGLKGRRRCPVCKKPEHGLRRAGAGVAAPGHVLVPNDSRRDGSPSDVCRARRAAGGSAVGGAGVSVHRAVRGAAIDWLRECSFAAVARQLQLTWDQVAGIQERAVRRGLARRGAQRPTRIGIDETSFQKRHEYVTVVNDLEKGQVLHVADDRKRDSLDAFYLGLGPPACNAITTVAMDMWGPYISSTHEFVPDVAAKVLFDKFHIAQHLGDAVDRVRREENRLLTAHGDYRLKGSKYLWLTHPAKLSAVRWWQFEPLRNSRLRVARAWALKESAMTLWSYEMRGWAERAWKRWCSWAMRCRLEPVKRVARMIREHWDGVMNAATSNITNARSESINAKVQWIKRMACGYRNRDNFRNAIYFHLGGLHLYPEAVNSAHSNA